MIFFCSWLFIFKKAACHKGKNEAFRIRPGFKLLLFPFLGQAIYFRFLGQIGGNNTGLTRLLCKLNEIRYMKSLQCRAQYLVLHTLLNCTVQFGTWLDTLSHCFLGSLCLRLLSLLSWLDCNPFQFRDYISFSSCTCSSMKGFWSQGNTCLKKAHVNKIKYIPELHTVL